MRNLTDAQSKLDHIEETKKLVAALLTRRRKEFVGDVFQDEMSTEEFEHSLGCVAEVIDDSYWLYTKSLHMANYEESLPFVKRTTQVETVEAF